MILNELVLENFGSFAGRQTLQLKPTGGKPIVLIGALNGSGKTTVLEALQLALYGPLAPAGVRRGASHEAYLSHMIHRGADRARGARVELSFDARVGRAHREFRVERAWWVGAKGRVKEELRVSVDGREDGVIGDAWAEHVEQLVPRGVAGLFFFDGEQIEAFADFDASRELIQTAVSGLLGLELIDRLVVDLEVLERRKRSAAVQPDDQPQLDALARWLDGLRAEEAELRQQLDEADAELARATTVLAQTEDRLEREGGAAFDDRVAREAAAVAAQTRRVETEHRLIEASSGFAPLLLIADLVGEVARQSRAERANATDQALARRLARRDTQLMDRIAVLAADRHIDEDAHNAIAEWLRQDRANTEGGDVPVLLDCDERTALHASQLAESGLATLRTQLTDLVTEVETARESVDAAQRALDAVPSSDGIADLLDQRDRAHQAVAAAAHEKAERETALARARSTRERAETRRDAALVEAARNRLETDEAQRLLGHSARARVTLHNLRKAATARHAQRIQTCALEATRTLLRKPNLITDITINPANHALALHGPNGELVRPAGLSAGERQLLAVSLLWGLARAAGRPLPVVIDTPLGRLDGPHRGRLLERYLPAASHQVIVLSTDTELDARALEQIRPSLSHALHLDHDPARHATTVEDGYLDSREGSVA